MHQSNSSDDDQNRRTLDKAAIDAIYDEFPASVDSRPDKVGAPVNSIKNRRKCSDPARSKWTGLASAEEFIKAMAPIEAQLRDMLACVERGEAVSQTRILRFWDGFKYSRYVKESIIGSAWYAARILSDMDDLMRVLDANFASISRDFVGRIVNAWLSLLERFYPQDKARQVKLFAMLPQKLRMTAMSSYAEKLFGEGDSDDIRVLSDDWDAYFCAQDWRTKTPCEYLSATSIQIGALIDRNEEYRALPLLLTFMEQLQAYIDDPKGAPMTSCPATAGDRISVKKAGRMLQSCRIAMGFLVTGVWSSLAQKPAPKALPKTARATTAFIKAKALESKGKYSAAIVRLRSLPDEEQTVWTQWFTAGLYHTLVWRTRHNENYREVLETMIDPLHKKLKDNPAWMISYYNFRMETFSRSRSLAWWTDIRQKSDNLLIPSRRIKFMEQAAGHEVLDLREEFEQKDRVSPLEPVEYDLEAVRRTFALHRRLLEIPEKARDNRWYWLAVEVLLNRLSRPDIYGFLPRAIEYIDRMPNPDIPQVRLLLGRALMMLGAYDRAKACFESALAFAHGIGDYQSEPLARELLDFNRLLEANRPGTRAITRKERMPILKAYKKRWGPAVAILDGWYPAAVAVYRDPNDEKSLLVASVGVSKLPWDDLRPEFVLRIPATVSYKNFPEDTTAAMAADIVGSFAYYFMENFGKGDFRSGKAPLNHSYKHIGPLGRITDMSHAMLELPPDAPALFPDGPTLVTIHPLYQAEAAYGLMYSSERLVNHLLSNGVRHFTPDRRNTCEDRVEPVLIPAKAIKALLPEDVGLMFARVSPTVMTRGDTIVHMERLPASRPNDSGWCFYCQSDSDDEQVTAAQLRWVRLNTVCNYEPQVMSLLSAAQGTIFYRDAKGQFFCPDDRMRGQTPGYDTGTPRLS